MEGNIFDALWPWGALVLVAAVTGTSALKKQLKEMGMPRWVFMVLPLIIAGVGSAVLAYAGMYPWKQAPLLAFIIGLGGNALYKGYQTLRGGVR